MSVYDLVDAPGKRIATVSVRSEDHPRPGDRFETVHRDETTGKTTVNKYEMVRYVFRVMHTVKRDGFRVGGIAESDDISTVIEVKVIG